MIFECNPLSLCIVSLGFYLFRLFNASYEVFESNTSFLLLNLFVEISKHLFKISSHPFRSNFKP